MFKERKKIFRGSHSRLPVGRNIFLSVLMLVAAINGFGQVCEVTTTTGVADAEFNQIFTQNGPGQGLEPAGAPGWTGADSTYSLLLPGGHSVFIFSDSYVGSSPAATGDGTGFTNANGLRTRIPNCGPPLCDPPVSIFTAHNTLVTKNAVTNELKTLAGMQDINGWHSSYMAPPGAAATNHFYWMGDAGVVQTDQAGTKKVWLFVMEWDNQYTFYGSAIAQLSLPDLSVETIIPLVGTQSSTIQWGAALTLEGNYPNQTLYIYGMQNQQAQTGKVPYVARVNASAGYVNAVNANNWEVWNGAGWSAGVSGAAQLLGAANDPRNAGDRISDEFSVKKIRVGTRDVYVLTGMNTAVPFGSWKDVTLYSSCSPQGPFSRKHVLFTTPEAGARKVFGMTAAESLAGTLFVYNPHMHDQFLNENGYLFSYNSNAGVGQDLKYVETYRPRFFRSKILPLAPTAAPGEVSGKITDARGRALNNVRVRLVNTSDNSDVSVTTDENGRYFFRDIQTGTVLIISAKQKGTRFAPESQVINFNEDRDDVDFTGTLIRRNR